MIEKNHLEVDLRKFKFSVSGKSKTIVICIGIIATIFLYYKSGEWMVFPLMLILFIIGLSFLTYQDYRK